MLPRDHRLPKERFIFLRTHGVKSNTPSLLAKTTKTSTSTRVGIIVPRKNVKTAVKRNRIKRRVHEAAYKAVQQQPNGIDILLVAYPHSLEEPIHILTGQIITFLNKAH